MALYKLNTFHWHLTDDQGWRIEIRSRPRLTEVGSRRGATPLPHDRHQSDGAPYAGHYTQDEVRRVVAYAAARGITVVPEIEMPGHALAALASYPELGCRGQGYQVGTSWGIESEVLCAGRESTFTFLEEVLSEVLELFPSRFIHVGGDECPKQSWRGCRHCQERRTAEGLRDEDQLQSWFIRRIGAWLADRGRRLVGWDEILEGGLAPGATVMSWRGIEGGVAAASSGHDVVMSPNTHCYFDYYQSRDTADEPPAIGGYLPLRQVYDFEPDCARHRCRPRGPRAGRAGQRLDRVHPERGAGGVHGLPARPGTGRSGLDSGREALGRRLRGTPARAPATAGRARGQLPAVGGRLIAPALGRQPQPAAGTATGSSPTAASAARIASMVAVMSAAVIP